MSQLLLVLIPAITGAWAFWIRSDFERRILLVLTAVVHLVLIGLLWSFRPAPVFGGWIYLDAPGYLFLAIASGLFLMATLYALHYLSLEKRGVRRDFQEGVLFDNAPEAIFTGSLLALLATMSLVCMSQHFGLLWVAIEATTLASAPLIYFHRHHRSLEATWKYLLVCSVGIALALLGNFFLSVASSQAHAPIVLGELLARGAQLQPVWLKAAFLFYLVGYGTKMGLAPLHVWKPEAYSEAPSVVAALLSGALSNCAFLGILRAYQVCGAADLAAFGQELLVVLGLVSMAFAALFVIRQTDYKQLLAYSSVEHMGILALGVGLGGGAVMGSMLHAVNHSVVKAMLFLVSGNILGAYGTRETSKVRGLSRALPVSGVLWLAGMLAITGTPPFGTFVSELTILKAALDQGSYGIAAAYLALLALIFIGMTKVMLGMAQGPSDVEARSELPLAVIPPLILGLASLTLGLIVPSVVLDAVRGAALVLGGS